MTQPAGRSEARTRVAPQGRRVSVVLAANAWFDRGGQGRVLRCLADAFEESCAHIFCRGPARSGVERVPSPSLATLLARLPVVRRRRDWLSLADDVQFDRWVTGRLPPADLFVGTVGHCSKAIREARRRGVRTLLSVPTMHVDHFRRYLDEECPRFGLHSPIGPGAYRRILEEYRAADIVCVLTERARRSFLCAGFDGGRLVVATPPMRLTEFEPATFGGDRFRVSFVGLIEPWKGFHYLLEAYSGLGLRDAELVLWGGPGSRAATHLLRQHQARNGSIRVQPVDLDQGGYERVYGKTSVLVHPSLTDGFAFAVVEAMASGVPVIVTENTGAADLVRDGENGYIVPIRDVGAIQERLRHLHAHPELLPVMGARAREAVLPLTPEAFRSPLLARVQQVVGERAGGPE